MPSSSDYATPIEIELSAGRLERGLLGLGALAAALSILLLGLPLGVRAALACALLLLLVRAHRQLGARSGRLILYADGLVGGVRQGQAVSGRLIQASGYGPALLLAYTLDDRAQALMLFPDQVSAETRQRLRLWLSAHRPQPLGAAA